jgi:peptide-methionine (S)-S-oxide reductase
MSGRTGHAESVQVVFDETVIPAEVVLDIFFLIHDPTTLNRQGADEGPQYRSTMFYSDSAQKSLFEAAVDRNQRHWSQPIVTTLEPLDAFYEAEPEHANYFENNPGNPYCSIVITPKVIKARHAYAEWF